MYNVLFLFAIWNLYCDFKKKAQSRIATAPSVRYFTLCS